MSVGLRRVIYRWGVPVLLVLYAFWPGDPNGLLTGAPWRLMGAVVLMSVGLGAWLQEPPTHPQRWHRIVTPVLLMAVVVRIGLSTHIIPTGWSSSILVSQPNGQTSQGERIGRRADDEGVIDRLPSVSNDSSSLQFFNDLQFASGGPNPARYFPWNMSWRGFLVLHRQESVQVVIEGAGGGSSVWLDGDRARREIPLTPAGVSQTFLLEPGIHEIVVQYQKDAGQAPAFRCQWRKVSGRPIVIYANRPEAAHLTVDRWARFSLRLLDLLVLVIGLGWLAMNVRAVVRTTKTMQLRSLFKISTGRRLVFAVVVLVLALQGLWWAHTHSGLTVFLNGDDMRNYATFGRDIALHGPLMNQGRPLGTGEPFFLYPLYPYFVAATHLLFDESLFGVLFLQFVLVGLTMVCMVAIARQLFGDRVCGLSLVALLVLAQVDFTRWYTVTVLSDNLYHTVVVIAVWATMQLCKVKRWWGGPVLAGFLCGAATLTRPSFITFLPFAGWWVWRIACRPTSGRQRTAQALMFMGSWVGTIGLATLRNVLVSGRFVFLVESGIQVLLFLAPPGIDYRTYLPPGGHLPSMVEVGRGALAMIIHHPLQTSLVLLRKLAFMVGFTNLAGYHFHPEFLLLALGYALWWLIARQSESKFTLVHLFLASHVLALLIASPSTYGYKNILPLTIFFVPFTMMTFLKTKDLFCCWWRVRCPVVADQESGG